MRNFNFILCFVILALLANCSPKYHRIEPLKVQFDRSEHLANAKEVYIAYRYHVLREARNRNYAAAEQRHDIQLIAIKVENQSSDTLYFPDDFYLIAHSDTLALLSMTEAFEVLNQTIVIGANDSNVESNTPVIGVIGEVFDVFGQIKSGKRFQKELNEFYLAPCRIDPGNSTVGLLAIKVQKSPPLHFLLKK